MVREPEVAQDEAIEAMKTAKNFLTFDAPSRDLCSPRRFSSNTPLQALVTLNPGAFTARRSGTTVWTSSSGV